MAEPLAQGATPEPLVPVGQTGLGSLAAWIKSDEVGSFPPVLAEGHVTVRLVCPVAVGGTMGFPGSAAFV